MQSASDVFLGWERAAAGLDPTPHDYYLRQLWDRKIAFDIETMRLDATGVYSKMCAWTLARAHARTGDPIAISVYLGQRDSADRALVAFAAAYADQNQHDYQSLVAAVKRGRIKAETDV
jgi:hypothetical protein